MIRVFGLVAVLAFAGNTGAVQHAAAKVQSAKAQNVRIPDVKSGALTCDVSAGLGAIVGSKKQISCLFTPARPGPQEAYVGTIDKFESDATAGEQMVWEVRAPNRQFGELIGDYTGDTLRAGGGERVLVGGTDRAATLQPVSIDKQVGVNLAAGVTELRLRPAR